MKTEDIILLEKEIRKKLKRIERSKTLQQIEDVREICMEVRFCLDRLARLIEKHKQD